MNTISKTFAAAALAAFALAFTGCSSYSEIARWRSTTPINDGEVPIASFVTQNFSYKLLWCVPLSTGLPWTEGTEDIKDEFNVKFFADEATIDNNLLSLRHALDRVGGSRRVTQLHTKVDNDYFWSLFIVNRHEVRTQCLILQ